MAKKKEFTPEQQHFMSRAGHDWRYFELINDVGRSMLVKDKQTKQVILVQKELGRRGSSK